MIDERIKRLNALLGISPPATTKSAAPVEELTPEELHRLFLKLEDAVPEGDFKDKLREVFLEEIEASINRFKEERSVATKSAGRKLRGSHGEVLDKEFAPDGARPAIKRGPNGRVRRDAAGRRRDKPNDPDQARRPA
jgi:hypothetical protein